MNERENLKHLIRTLMAQPTGYPWPDPTNERIQRLEAENERLREELAKAREVTDEKVERVAGALAAHWTDRHTNEALGRQKVLARHALYAALGGGGGDDA